MKKIKILTQMHEQKERAMLQFQLKRRKGEKEIIGKSQNYFSLQMIEITPRFQIIKVLDSFLLRSIDI
jgi:hypothetical protein